MNALPIVRVSAKKLSSRFFEKLTARVYRRPVRTDNMSSMEVAFSLTRFSQ